MSRLVSGAVDGKGFDVFTGAAVGVVGAAYLPVALLQPLIDPAVLAAGRAMRGVTAGGVLQSVCSAPPDPEMSSPGDGQIVTNM